MDSIILYVLRFSRVPVICSSILEMLHRSGYYFIFSRLDLISELTVFLIPTHSQLASPFT